MCSLTDVTVKVSGAQSPASLERLLAPSAAARDGVTLAGQTFGETRNGKLVGPVVQSTVYSGSRGYPVSLPPASVVLLTLR